jgi:glutathione S-transferase
MMVLYSGTTCPFSQRCRLVLFEKGMDFETVMLICLINRKIFRP